LFDVGGCGVKDRCGKKGRWFASSGEDSHFSKTKTLSPSLNFLME